MKLALFAFILALLVMLVMYLPAGWRPIPAGIIMFWFSWIWIEREWLKDRLKLVEGE